MSVPSVPVPLSPPTAPPPVIPSPVAPLATGPITTGMSHHHQRLLLPGLLAISSRAQRPCSAQPCCNVVCIEGLSDVSITSTGVRVSCKDTLDSRDCLLGMLQV